MLDSRSQGDPSSCIRERSMPKTCEVAAYGSEWFFRPLKMEQNRAIQVHSNRFMLQRSSGRISPESCETAVGKFRNRLVPPPAPSPCG